MKAVSVLFFLSGFAALVYELLWVRHLGLIFGNTIHAAAAVLTAYMLGLAIGAKLASMRADRVKRPIRAFGIIQIAIGLYSLCMPLLFLALQLAYRCAYRNLSEAQFLLSPFRFVASLLLMLIPTILMGATLPVVSSGLIRSREGFARRLGTLYGLNTLGAVAGILACGFVLLPRVGLTATNVFAVWVSIGVGFAAFVASGKLDPVISGELRSDAPTPPPRLTTRSWLLLGCTFMSGLIALALEIVWFRALILIFGSTTYSFSAMMSVFLLGLGLGAALLGWLGDRVKKPMMLFAAAQAVIGAYTLLSLYLFCSMPGLMLNYLAISGLSWGNMLAVKFVVTLIFLFLPTSCLGIAFTVAARALRNELPSSSGSVGRAYAFNTTGAAAGSFIAGFVFLPLLGMEASLVLLSCMALILASAVVLFQRAETGTRVAVALVSIACAVATLKYPPSWNDNLLAAGPYFSPWNYISDGRITLNDQIQSDRLLLHHEGLTSTVSVIRAADEGLCFSTNGKVEADTSPRSMMLQRMMGHLPMLLHPDPRVVVNIGLGAGVTFGSLGCYPVDHLEVVEIEPYVKEVARAWSSRNHSIMSRDDVILTINDGRNHLFCTDRKYDVITSDPFEPSMAGAGNLYTVEHFAQARSKLNPDGIMAQYLPLYELSGADFRVVLRSFAHVFPGCLLLYTGGDTILIGFNGNCRLDLAVAERHLETVAVSNSLHEIGFTEADAIMGMLVAAIHESDDVLHTVSLNTDTRPIIEFSAPKSSLKYMVSKNQTVLLNLFGEIPSGIITGATKDELEDIRREREGLRATLLGNIRRSEGQTQEAFDLMMEAARLAPGNPVVRNEFLSLIMSSADSMRGAGELDQARAQYELALRYSPSEFWALYHLVTMGMQARQVQYAAEMLQRGVKAYPESPLFMALRGKFRGSMGDPHGACADLSAALKQLPNRVDFWRDYALFAGIAQQWDEKRVAEEHIQRLDPNGPSL